MTQSKSKMIWRLTALIYFAVLAFLCFYKFTPSQDIPTTLFGIPSDKIVHFVMFLPFPIICLYAFHSSNGKVGRFVLFLFVMYIAGLLLASGIEIGQKFVGYRSGDVWDFVADSIGLATGTLIIVAYRTALRKW